MNKLERMSQAYGMQDACNPLPVARFFADCIHAANFGPDTEGTDSWIKDPACIVLLDKLNAMYQRHNPSGFATEAAMHACHEAAIDLNIMERMDNTQKGEV